MRAPEDYLIGIIKVNQKNLDAGIKPMISWDEAQEAIRQAQIEAIEECAGIAAKVLKHEHQEPLLDEINDEILQLKNQVK